MRVVLCSWNPLQLACRDKFTHQDTAAAFDTLPAVVGELHFFLVKGYTVTEDGKHGTRPQNIGVEAFFLERIVLCKTGLIYQVHGLFHRISDILVIGWQREEIVVDFLYIVW